MIKALVDRARHAVPCGGELFIHQAIDETGCSKSLALHALRLIIARHRPQAGRLHGYLARFSAADRRHWIELALAAERAAMASILIGDLADEFSVDRPIVHGTKHAAVVGDLPAGRAAGHSAQRALVVGDLPAGRAVPEPAVAEADQVRRAFVRAFPQVEQRPARGLALLDAALRQMRDEAGGVLCDRG